MEIGIARGKDRGREPGRSSDPREAEERALTGLGGFSSVAPALSSGSGKGPLAGIRTELVKAGRHLEAVRRATGVPPERVEAEVNKVAFATARQMARLRWHGYGPSVEAGRDRVISAECRERAARAMATRLANGSGDLSDLKSMVFTSAMLGIDLRDVAERAPAGQPSQLSRLAVVAGSVLGRLDEDKMLAMSREARVALSEWAIRNGIRAAFFSRVLEIDGAAHGDPDMHAKRLARDVGDRVRGVTSQDVAAGIALAREVGRARNVRHAFRGRAEEAFSGPLSEALGPGHEDQERLIRRPSHYSEDALEGSVLTGAVGRSRLGASEEVMEQVVRGLPEERLARQIARELNPYEGLRCVPGRTRDDAALDDALSRSERQPTLYSRWGGERLADVVVALKAADALEGTRESLERAKAQSERILVSLARRERDLADAMRKAGQGAGVGTLDTRVDVIREADGAFRHRVDRLAATMPLGLGGAVKLLGGGVGKLLGRDGSALAEAEAHRDAALAATPEVVEARRGVDMLRERLTRSYMRETELAARVEKLEKRAKRADCGLDRDDFDGRMLDAARTLSAAARQLQSLRPEIGAFVGAQVEGAPRHEIAKLADALERRCRAEFGVGAVIAVEALAARQQAERALRNEVKEHTTEIQYGLGDEGYEPDHGDGRVHDGARDVPEHTGIYWRPSRIVEAPPAPERPAEVPDPAVTTAGEAVDEPVPAEFGATGPVSKPKRTRSRKPKA